MTTLAPAAFAQSFSDNFEASAIDPFWASFQQLGTIALSTDQSVSGTQSVKLSSTAIGQRNIWLVHSFTQPTKGTLSVWFYDGSAGTPTLYAGLYASNSTTNDGYGVNVADWSGSNYIWHGPGINETPTFVGRTVGWHEFTLEVTDTGFQAKVDQTIVGTVAGDFAFDTVQLLLSGPGGSPATFYFDDFEFAAPDSNVAYDACLLYDPAKVVRQNATVPIKLQACDANRANLSGPELPVIAVDVLRVSNDSEGELDDSGNANPDMNFRYDGTLEGYIFNLSTRQLTPGSYVLRFTIGEDPTLHSAAFAVR